MVAGARRPGTAPVAALIIVLAALLAACTPATSGGRGTLKLLAGSELKDLGPLMSQVQRDTGYTLEFTYTGTLEGAERIVAGEKADLAWYASNKYLTLLQGSTRRILAQEKLMLSPVILGVKDGTARRLGWKNASVTWRDVALAAKAGQFRFGMTDPSASNTGFSALVGVASAFAANGNALTLADIQAPLLRDFFSGQTLTAGSSGFLAEAYVQSQDTLDGLINYESVLLSLNAGTSLREKLNLVYPTEGIVTADYPLMLLNAEKRDAYDTLVGYFRKPDVQRQLMTMTSRRPAIRDVPLDNRFPTQVLIELPFPSSLEVIDALLLAYQNDIRIPSHAFYVLDLSGSMQGKRLETLKHALTSLTGLDTSVTGVFARFRAREEITIITFATTVQDSRHFLITNPDPSGPDLASLRTYINSLNAGGNTAIYDALARAYELAGQAKARDPTRFYSVVLMTDGENNAGRDGNQFLREYRAYPAERKGIKTFTVLFGEANPEALGEIAKATGGAVFDSRKTALSQIFKEIRGYQ